MRPPQASFPGPHVPLEEFHMSQGTRRSYSLWPAPRRVALHPALMGCSQPRLQTRLFTGPWQSHSSTVTPHQAEETCCFCLKAYLAPTKDMGSPEWRTCEALPAPTFTTEETTDTWNRNKTHKQMARHRHGGSHSFTAKGKIPEGSLPCGWKSQLWALISSVSFHWCCSCCSAVCQRESSSGLANFLSCWEGRCYLHWSPVRAGGIGTSLHSPTEEQSFSPYPIREKNPFCCMAVHATTFLILQQVWLDPQWNKANWWEMYMS